MSDHTVCDAQDHATFQDYLACTHCVSDDDLWNLAGTPSIAWADACRELHRRLVEARDAIRRLEEVNASNQRTIKEIVRLNSATTTYLSRIYAITREADEEFGFTWDADPDGAPDDPGGRD